MDINSRLQSHQALADVLAERAAGGGRKAGLMAQKAVRISLSSPQLHHATMPSRRAPASWSLTALTIMDNQ